MFESSAHKKTRALSACIRLTIPSILSSVFITECSRTRFQLSIVHIYPSIQQAACWGEKTTNLTIHRHCQQRTWLIIFCLCLLTSRILNPVISESLCWHFGVIIHFLPALICSIWANDCKPCVLSMIFTLVACSACWDNTLHGTILCLGWCKIKWVSHRLENYTYCFVLHNMKYKQANFTCSLSSCSNHHPGLSTCNQCNEYFVQCLFVSLDVCTLSCVAPVVCMAPCCSSCGWVFQACTFPNFTSGIHIQPQQI